MDDVLTAEAREVVERAGRWRSMEDIPALLGIIKDMEAEVRWLREERAADCAECDRLRREVAECRGIFMRLLCLVDGHPVKDVSTSGQGADV